MAEGFKITIRRRDEIWREIQTAINDRKKKDIQDILFDGCKGMIDDVQSISNVIDTYDNMLDNWNRFLHGGKTDKEEQEERERPFREVMEDLNKKNDEILKKMGFWSAFGFRS